MQLHTFIAESANEAVEQIRAQLGPAAVVVSVRKLPRSGVSRFLKQEQIEVVAAIEPAATATPAKPAPAVPALDPIAELRQEVRALKDHILAGSQRADSAFHHFAKSCVEPAQRSESSIASFLARTGIMPVFAEQIADEIGSGGDPRNPAAARIEAISQHLRRKWKGEPERSEAGVHLFVGVHGSGKSTALCKMLAQVSLAGAQPAAIYQLDTQVTNTSPQPPVYAEILGAEFDRNLPLEFEWREQSVFIDLPGVELGNERGLAAIEKTASAFGMPAVHLVLNAAYESAHLLDQVRFFSKLGISDLILTHLDEESRWGKIWNLVLGTNYGIRFLSAGQNIPGEFIPAGADVILSRQFR